MTRALVYGSYGYAGDLIARETLDSGLDLLLAGRNETKLREQSEELGADWVAFGLDETDAMEAALEDVGFVINCAGPFEDTAEPIVESCLSTGTHYLDITGEIQVLQALAARDEDARQADVMVMPAASFDVVATDCLAAFLTDRLPTATELTLGVDIVSAWDAAAGPLATVIEQAGEDGKGAILGDTIVRRGGELETHPPAWQSRDIDFGYETTRALSIPWGDVVTAPHTTGIQNVEVYAGLSGLERLFFRGFRYTKWLYRYTPLPDVLAGAVRQFHANPTERERERDRSGVWGRVTDEEGNAAEARLVCPGTYEMTAGCTAVTAARVSGGPTPAGFQTPAGVYGPDLVLDVDGVEREDIA